MSDEVKMISIERIRILNPRQRDQKKFELIVQSIKNLGLKMPVQVSLRSENEPEGPGYDLICGQGRIEAFIALGHKEIPAIVVEISKEERLIRSLVENIARRHPAPMDLIREIERLHAQGYNHRQISKKLDVSDTTVNGLMTLKKAGEERLLEAAVTGKIPLWVAIDIAKTDNIETQRELLKAYENKQLDYLSIRTVKRLIEQRRLIGKQCGGGSRQSARTSAESLVSAYRRESQRQKLMVKKARVCDARLTFVVTAFNKLLADEHFVTLLRAESLAAMPKYLWEKLTPQNKEAA
jgi:ParB family chromosome partitioning protein